MSKAQDNGSPKICCVISSLGVGGMERVMSIIVNGFTQKGEVHIILYGKNPKIFYLLDPRVIVHKPDFVFTNRIMGILRTFVFLRSEIKKIKPTAILSFGEDWNNFALLATRFLNIPIFVSDRASPYCQMSKIHKFLRIKLYPHAAGVILQTNKAKEIFSKLYKQSNFNVIGNPIQKLAIPANNKRENIIVSVGRLAKSKNYDRLIQLFNDLHRNDWKLIIVGGDTQKQNNMELLQKQIKSYGNPPNIILAGTQSNVNEYLLKSKIFAFTSSSEGFPNAIGEAMAAGLPVVSYDCVAGPSDMIEDGETGFLIPLFDDETFKQKLNMLLDDEELRSSMGEKAHASISKFDSEKIVELFYQSLTH